MNKYVCCNCGKTFYQYKWEKKCKRVFCSFKCYSSFRKVPKILIACKKCGAKFEAYPSKHKKYCSPQCYLNDIKNVENKGRFKWKTNINKETLFNLYWSRSMNIYEIGKIYGTCGDSIHRHLLTHGIPRRSNSEAQKLIWENEDYAKRQHSLMLKALATRPTRLEAKIIKIIRKNNLPYKYTGNGEFFVGRRCPDFVCSNGLKVVEVFGSFWHRMDLNQKVRKNQTYENTLIHYNQHGFACLILWDYELDNEKEINNRLEKFATT